MNELVTKLLYDLLILLATVAAGLLVAWLKQKIGTEGMKKIERELATKQELAALAVRFVQQVYTEHGGPRKYHFAAEWLSKMAKEKGLKVSSDEIKGLIEAAIRAFKDEFGEEWGKITK